VIVGIGAGVGAGVVGTDGTDGTDGIQLEGGSRTHIRLCIQNITLKLSTQSQKRARNV